MGRYGVIAVVETSRLLPQTEEDRRREHAQSRERRETRRRLRGVEGERERGVVYMI